MATPRDLARPPIKEALVDLRCAVSQPREAFEAFADQLKADFPQREVRNAYRAELKIEDGKVVPPTTELLGFQAIKMTSADGSLVVQFGPEGFTVNNLNSYMGGEALIKRALELWSRFAAAMKVESVSRVAFRYINRLDLPYGNGEDFRRFLTAPPDLPPPVPQRVSEFLGRVVSHDQARNVIVIVTQRLQPEDGFLVDIDVVRAESMSSDAAQLRVVLETLRVIKNEVFFSLLTEEAVSLYA